MKLKQPYLILFLTLLVIFSCNKVKQMQETEMGEKVLTRKLTNPKVTKLNINEGYFINQYSGDTIQPIINSIGDTIITGVLRTIKGTVIHPDSVVKPITIPAVEPKVASPRLNIHKVPENLTSYPLNKDSLKTIKPGIETSSFILVNSTGDIIPTGVPIPVNGRVLSLKFPKPEHVSLPQIKDNNYIKFLGIDQNMPTLLYKSIFKDSRGNIWLGTLRSGIIMYDGNNIFSFSENRILEDIGINSICEDSRGNLWFGTYKEGVLMYNGHKFIQFSEKEGLSNNDVEAIMEDLDGNLWFGTRKGLCKYDGNSFIHFTKKEGLNDNWILNIIEDKQGNLWIITNDGSINMYNEEGFVNFPKKGKMKPNSSASMFEDSLGNLWFGINGNGAIMYDGEKFLHFTKKEGLSGNIVYEIKEDSQGYIWMGTENGLSRYDGNIVPEGYATFIHYTENEGYPSHAEGILEGIDGQMWFASTIHGLYKYKINGFRNYTTKEGLSDNTIYSIFEDSQGALWFGSHYGGVNRNIGISEISSSGVDKDAQIKLSKIHTGFAHFAKDNGLNHTTSIFEDNLGNMWFASGKGGVSKFNGEYFTHFSEREGLLSFRAWDITQDYQNNLWISSYFKGISVYNGDYFTHYTDKNGLSNVQIESIVNDKNDNLWIASYGGGVSRYKDGTITHFTEKEGMSSNKVFSVYEDTRGNLWFGTADAGVSMFDGKRFTYYTEEDGLSNNTIWSIIEDNDHNIWLGTQKGLSLLVFDPVNSQSFPTIQTFDRQDGLNAMSFLRNSVIIDKNNSIWWGTTNGITRLDLNNFKISDKSPSINLNQIAIKGKFIDYRNIKDGLNSIITFDSVARFQNYPLKLSLPYDQNHLTFHFSAIDWSAPDKIKYSYKMDGLSDKWSEPIKESKAEYRNLSYGKFTFKVKAIGAAQIWSKPFEYSFYIAPPWWHTWWARITYAISGILLVVGIVKIRTNSINKQKTELKLIVKNRTKKISSQKEELEISINQLKKSQSLLVQSKKMASIGILIAGITHEINNPVNFTRASSIALNQDVEEILELIEKYKTIIQIHPELLKEIEEYEKSIDLDSIISAVKESIADINNGTKRTMDLVGGLKEFSHNEKGNKLAFNINDGINNAVNLLKGKINNKITLIKDLDKNVETIMCHINQIERLFVNLIDNALDAVDKEGKIIIRSKNLGDQLLISIEDNGYGIADEDIDKIFDPFFTKKDIGKGTGLGLSISLGIINNHNGTVSINSILGEGTRIEILFPIK